MTPIVKTPEQLNKMRASGKIMKEIFAELHKFIKPGITTKQIDKFVYDYIKKSGAKPSFLGHEGFPATICASVNEVVVHGIPSEYVLKDGDIVGVDVGVCVKGFHTDAARTYKVGKVNALKNKLVRVTEECFFHAIKHLKAGSFVGDIGAAVQEHAEKNGFGVVRVLCGHGIGKNVHEAPQIPNFGASGTGVEFKAGMTICIEPMLNAGTYEVEISTEDGWTCKTADGQPAAHYENTLLITETGVEVLTI
ncbi:MAG: type I methionyl aminopeptidase [Firmicutes bacterium]|nr:type I methionyl aminopeptidase [Bacillota bacterium]